MKKVFSIILAIAMLASMMTTAFAVTIVNNVSADQAKYYDSGALKSITINFKWVVGGVSLTNTTGVNMVLMSKKLDAADYTSTGNYKASYKNIDEAQADTALGFISMTELDSVANNTSYNWEFGFSETDIPLDTDATYYINIWTQRYGWYYPDALGAVIQVKDGAVYYVATGDGFNAAVSAVMALSVLAGAAVVLGKKK